MTVLKILAIVLLAILIYVFILKVNGYTNKKYKYEIFNLGNYVLSVIAYLLAFFGNKLHVEALNNHGDVLNGELLMLFATLLILLVIYNNVKKTNSMFGLLFSVVQQILYLVLTIPGLYAAALILAYFANTRPVFDINK